MGLVSRIAEAAGVPIQQFGSKKLIADMDAEAFLRAALDFNVAIIGIEGFEIRSGHLVPDMNAIADFSGVIEDVGAVSITNQEARRFLLNTLHPELYFEFEVMGHSHLGAPPLGNQHATLTTKVQRGQRGAWVARGRIRI